MSAITAQHILGISRHSVDAMLDEVSYHDSGEYVPSLFALEMVNFIKLVNGPGGEENKTPVLHMKMLDQIARDDENVANMVFRGAAKSTLMEYLVFYIAVYGSLPGLGEVTFILYVSDSIENGIKTMRKSLQYRWENSDFLMKYLPESRFTDVRWDFWNISGRKTTIKGYGAKTGVRGTREDGQRPQLALLDDLISDEDARSATIIASVEDTVYKAVDYALHTDRRKIIWNGTPFNQNDPLYKAIESGAWTVNVFPVCEFFDDNTTEVEFSGAWPDRHTYKYVKGMYMKAKLAGRLESFYQELMLRISSEEDRIIRDNDMIWFDNDDVMKKQKDFNFYITTDFATSEKQSADYSVLSVWGYSSGGSWHLVDGELGRNLMSKNIDILFDMAVKYDVKSVGVEISGQQKGFVDWIRKEMFKRKVYFQIVEVRPSSDKLSRFHLVVPQFKQGLVWFNRDLKKTAYGKELQNELKYAVGSGFRSKHDDILDTISMLPHMNPWKPAVPVEARGYEDPFYDEPTNDDILPIGSYIV